MPQHHLRPAGLPPVNGYSHVISFSGQMAVVSGQLPLDAYGELVGQDDPREQARQVFENLSTALAAVGAEVRDIVKITVYVTDLADLEEFRLARDEYISREHPPASSLVQVGGLVHPGARIEIDALAVIRPAPTA
ncbi:RidA family protein [Nonomuraea polychroma]|uniref:RidA family protein n=1 Tax=Nonomuraea polychroma TaxID=46176 RepID=UPI003D8F0988